MKLTDAIVFVLSSLAIACVGTSETLAVDDTGVSRRVGSALDLRRALSDPDTKEVLIDSTIVINDTEWGGSVAVRSLNVSIRATDALLTEARYATINFGASVMLFSLAPGAVMTWVGIDVYFAQATLGAAFRPLRQSPGAVLVFSKCLIHRLVGLPLEAGLASARSTERSAAFPIAGTGAQNQQQVVGVVSNMTWATTGSTSTGTGPHHSTPSSTLFMPYTWALYDFAEDVALDSSLASQGFYFGGYTVVVNGPSYNVVDKEVDAACLAARPASECLTILLDQLEVSGHSPQQPPPAAGPGGEGAAAGGSEATNHATTVVVVAVVVPVTVVLLAALLVGSLWWARHRRLEDFATTKPTAAAAEASGGGGGTSSGCNTSAGAQPQGKQGTGARDQQQTAKASGGAAAAGDSGGLRLGVITGGVQRGDGGGVFTGVEGDQDLPPWSVEALREADELGEAYPNQRGLSQLASGLIKIGGRSVDGRTTSGGGVAADDATADTAAASARKLVAGGVHLLLSFGGGPQIQNQQQGPQQQGLPDQQQGQPQLQRLQVPADGPAQPLAAGPAARRGDCSAHELPQQQDQGSAAEPGPAGADIGGRGEVREGAALTRALEDSAAGVASNGAATRHGVNAGGQCAAGSSSSAAGAGAAVASAAATAADSTAAAAAAAAVADAAPQAGCMRVKPCDRIPSPDEVLAELGALVKEHRTNVNEAPFTLEAVLGHGSFGTVYKGTWQGLPVAIKTVVFSATQESRRQALKEAALCHSIIHPNIIATYATDLQPIGVLPGSGFDTRSHSSSTTPTSSARLYQITDWRLYIIQEFADGGPLGSLYGHPMLWLAPGVVELAAVVPLALGIARALAHLHSKRIVHGDLNPNNVLLRQDPTQPSGYAVKIGDFGLSVMLPQGRTHVSNLRMGTMFYICPAVVCQGQVGASSDVFSLGVLLWELFHGRRAGVLTKEGPRYCTSFPAFPPSCPEGYKAVALQCLQRQPSNRPTAPTIVTALEQLLLSLSLDPSNPQELMAPSAADIAAVGQV
ncbi:hypothetical protein CHLRE_12g545950v5 [Chlamydomonas reinhardtii]|uniref:Protein kinase domain-containing protein n=1 Tax=Chlamydomonas reinhardtii TaxID=3055 RepID=A0A2K3D6I5_CHLRE|nr:uncharacterized protein CHLRE_12g545950v5 [Chlamydomonas reinhardtii]PNW76146.1 hypothetical protein CHLRE_12g545950v5 [Chlamydomonas reinhardtii]